MPTAKCLCGQFTTSVTGSFGEVRYCHCSECRRKAGTAFTANAKVDRAQWFLEGPKEQIAEFEHKPGLYNAFCAKCGSPLFARSDENPNDIRIRLGGFDGDIEVSITGHVWVSSKARWYSIDDPIPQFEEQYVEHLE